MRVIFRWMKSTFWYAVIGAVQIIVFEAARFFFPAQFPMWFCLIFLVAAVLFPTISMIRQRVRF